MKPCKPTKEAILKRMVEAEKRNNKKGGTFYGGGKSHGIFPLEVFGIKSPTRTGSFTMDDIIHELKVISSGA